MMSMSVPGTSPKVGELIHTLALAWKNLAAYPPGHPALRGSVETAHRRLNELRGPAGEVVLGIGREGLVYGEDKIDSANAKKLAQALYTRGVALVRFDAATSAPELETFLRHLNTLPGQVQRPIWEELTGGGVVNIHLQPVDYSAIQATDDLATAPQQPISANLWDDILRALAAGRELTVEGRRLLSRPVRSMNELTSIVLEYMADVTEPTDTESQIDPKATFGIRFQARVPGTSDTSAMTNARLAEVVSHHIAKSTGLRKQLAVQQVMQLLRSLPAALRAAVLRSVVRVLSAQETDGSLLRDVTTGMPADEVLEALRYLGTASNLSSHAVRLLESLMPLELTREQEEIQPTSVSDLVQLFGEEDIDRFNPEDHRQLLDAVSVDVPQISSRVSPLSELGDRVDTVTDEAAQRALGRTLLELLEHYQSTQNYEVRLDRLEAVFHSELAGGHHVDALETIRRLQHLALTTTSAPLRDAIHESFSRMASAEAIDGLIQSIHTSPTANSLMIQQLLEAMGSAATRSLLLALAEEENRSRRRRLFDFVASLGTVIVPDAVQFLSDKRWFVVRNMIALLRTVGDRSSIPEIRQSAKHPDMRVRLEAIKTLMTLEPSLTRALLDQALNDPDPKLAETAIALVGSYGIKEAVDSLLGLVEGHDMFGLRRPLRIKALKALGELAQPAALVRLDRFFRDPFLPWPTRDERYAAYESLQSYPPVARLPIAERGLRSRDPHIREICERILEGPQ